MSLRVLVLWVAACLLVGARAELSLAMVRPEKVYVLPGETNTITVEVKNTDAAAAAAQLTVALVHELDLAVPLRDEAITVEPGKSVIWTLPWKAEPWLGIEARATLRRNGTVLEEKRDYFTCATNVHQVLVAGHVPLCTGAMDKDFDVTLKNHVTWLRALYANWAEHFAWAPSDYDDLVPSTDRFWSGQTQYNSSKVNNQQFYAAMRAQGIRSISYTKAGGNGPATFEFLRRHPEYAGYGEGHPNGGSYDTAMMDYLPAIGPPKLNDSRAVADLPEKLDAYGYQNAAWFEPYVKSVCTTSDIWYDGTNDGVIRHLSDQFAQTAKVMGFAGCRFDGEFSAYRFQRFDGSWNVPATANLDELDAKWVRDMKAYTWAATPGFLFGYNTHVDIRWDVANNSVPPAFKEKCKDGGLIVQEEMAFPGNIPWTTFVSWIKHHADIIRYYGGHYATIPFQRNPTVLYCYIVPSALRAHVHFAYNGKDAYGAFVTRNASLLWDENNHGWSGAADAFDVQATWAEPEAPEEEIDGKEQPDDAPAKGPAVVHELWWKPFAAVRPLKGGGTQILLHLINAPRNGMIAGSEPTTNTARKDYFDGMLPTGPATGVTVRWKAPAGVTRANVADFDRNDLQPVTAKKEGNSLVFSVPDVAHWSILILETNMPTPPAEAPKPLAPITAKTATAADLGLTPSTASSTWHLTMYAPDYNWNVGSCEMVRDADTARGWALQSHPGLKTYYMATATYFYPTLAGHYSATFRLKVADNTIDKPVVAISVEHTLPAGAKGIRALGSKPLLLKGTDFAKPNVYQEFTVTFDHPDCGYHALNASYLGEGTVSWDKTELQYVGPWKTEDFDDYYTKVNRPGSLEREPRDAPAVLLVRGPWNRLYKVDEALKSAGPVGDVSNGYIYFDFQNGTRVVGYTYTWESMFAQDVAVLIDAGVGGLGYAPCKMTREWVKDGGGLVVLGGMYTLGQAGDMRYGWSDLLPVTLNPPYEINKCDPPVRAALPNPALGLKGFAWKSVPEVYYRHAVAAKPGATVLLAGANGEPLIVGWQQEQGRVAVFTGTVLGDPAPGHTALWTAPEWPTLLGAVIKWVQGK
jgi:hypothetical protein